MGNKKYIKENLIIGTISLSCEKYPIPRVVSSIVSLIKIYSNTPSGI